MVADYCAKESTTGVVDVRDVEKHVQFPLLWDPHMISYDVNSSSIATAVNAALTAIRHKHRTIFALLFECASKISPLSIEKLLPPFSLFLSDEPNGPDLISEYGSRLQTETADLSKLDLKSRCDGFCQPLHFVPMFQCSTADFVREYKNIGEMSDSFRFFSFRLNFLCFGFVADSVMPSAALCKFVQLLCILHHGC